MSKRKIETLEEIQRREELEKFERQQNIIKKHRETIFELKTKEAISKYLEESQLDINAGDNDNKTILIVAAELNLDLELFRNLVELGADCTIVDECEKDALIHASSSDNLPVVQYLIEEIHCNINGSDDIIPIVFAAREGAKNVVEYLCSKGVDLTLRENEGRTAFAEACLYGHKEIVEFLYEKLGNTTLNVKDNYGMTPLMLALENYNAEEGNDFQIVSFLLSKGADLTIKDNGGNDVYDWCNGDEELIKIINEYADNTEGPEIRELAGEI